MEDLANAAIAAALDEGVEFVDVRVEDTQTTIIEISDGVTKRSMAAHLKGAGIRAFVDGSWGFSQTTDLTRAGMKKAGASVAKLALATREKVSAHFEIDGPSNKARSPISVKIPFSDIHFEDKIGFAKYIDEQAQSYDDRIANTRTIYGDLQTELYIVNSFGTSVYTENSLPRIISSLTATDGKNRRRASESIGIRSGFEFTESEEAQSIGSSTAELVIDLLSSKAAPGGVFDVVVDPVLNGVMVHEAFGHACEADNWPAHTTVLEDKIGKEVGPEQLNITDNPKLRGKRGSFDFDWEGTPTRKRTLVKDGVLTELLHDLETSSRLEMDVNGAARAQSFMHPPVPRMSNTYMEPGDWDVDELIADTESGILLCRFNYGYTEPAKGQFMFQAGHGYMIEGGELGHMVRDVSIAGHILDILAKVDAIGSDFELDAGNCGKGGQVVPDMSGGPHARIRNVPVGGM